MSVSINDLRYIKALSFPFIGKSIFKKRTVRDIKRTLTCVDVGVDKLIGVLEDYYFQHFDGDYIVLAMEGRSNQDRFVVDSINSHSNIDVYAVMDGHAGFKTVNLVDQHLLHFVSQMESMDFDNAEDMTLFLKGMYLEIDQFLLKKKVTDGSTLAIAVVGINSIYLCNVGDSKVCLFDSSGRVVAETTLHKPTNPSERNRIESFGGGIYYPKVVARVEGGLAMSRALGDFKYKISSKKLLKVKREHPDAKKGVSSFLEIPTAKTVNHYGMVSSEAEVIHYSRNRESERGLGIFLASDGVVDVFDNQEIIDKLKDQGKKGVLSLVKECAQKTKDDITFIFVSL